MVAPRQTKKVFCTVVCVPEADDSIMNTTSRFSTRPSELLPWADPYIARLVSNLQEEIRNERTLEPSRCSRQNSLQADLDPPSPADLEWEWHEDTRWTLHDET